MRLVQILQCVIQPLVETEHPIGAVSGTDSADADNRQVHGLKLSRQPAPCQLQVAPTSKTNLGEDPTTEAWRLEFGPGARPLHGRTFPAALHAFQQPI